MDNTEQCAWISDDFTRVCVNYKSEYCADFVWNDECDSCEYKEYIIGVDLESK